MMPGPQRKPLLERFMEYVMPEPMSGCWLWVGYTHQNGYGSISLGKRHDKMAPAHRVSYALLKGQIPDGMKVLHKCDVRCCVNPDHLFLGTQRDNIHDMIGKGRRGKTGVPGIRHGCAKLTEAQVLKIRTDARKQIDIAAECGVTPQAVNAIKRRKSWTHL